MLCWRECKGVQQFWKTSSLILKEYPSELVETSAMGSLAERKFLKEIKSISSEDLKTLVNDYSLLGLFKTFLLRYREMDQMSSYVLLGI